MENAAILTADILDIIFEGRNKSYGAYELRRTYNKRLYISISVMLCVILLFFGAYALPKGKKGIEKTFVVEDQVLSKVEEPEPVIPPVEPPKPPPQQQTQQKMFTTFKLTNEEVKPEEKPPEMTELEDVKIGTKNADGVKDDGLVGPPEAVSDGRGVIELPKKPEESDRPFEKVEIDASYPGGLEKWRRFLNKTLSSYPQEALDNNIQGTVIVMFIVDREGNVSEVQAISGPEELRQAAVKAVQKSGKWIPAIQNGQKVKAYKKQPISFLLPEE